MFSRLALSFLFLGSVASFAVNVTFYTSQAAFQAAIAGLPQQTITFDNIATGTYSTLLTQGISFAGDYLSPGAVHVADQASWTLLFFGSATGNSLVSIGNFAVTLPSGISAAGFLVGASGVSVVGFSSLEVLTADGTASGSVTATPSNLFPFLGVVSSSPISALQIHSSATLLTIDNFNFAGAGAVPEPASAPFLAITLAALILRRRLQR